MKLFLTLFLILLVSCTAPIIEEKKVQNQEKKIIHANINTTVQEKKDEEESLPVKTVIQTSQGKKITYGLNENNEIIKVDFPDKEYKIYYEEVEEKKLSISLMIPEN